jgi:hypothetical protein
VVPPRIGRFQPAAPRATGLDTPTDMRALAAPDQTCAADAATGAVASVRRQRAPWSGAIITTSGLVLRQPSLA